MNALHTIPAMSMLDLHIARLEKQADSIVVLDLCRPDGGPLPPFEAGAHVDLHLADGFVRQYSLCGAPSDRPRAEARPGHVPYRAIASAHHSQRHSFAPVSYTHLTLPTKA